MISLFLIIFILLLIIILYQSSNDIENFSLFAVDNSKREINSLNEKINETILGTQLNTTTNCDSTTTTGSDLQINVNQLSEIQKQLVDRCQSLALETFNSMNKMMDNKNLSENTIIRLTEINSDLLNKNNEICKQLNKREIGPISQEASNRSVLNCSVNQTNFQDIKNQMLNDITKKMTEENDILGKTVNDVVNRGADIVQELVRSTGATFNSSDLKSSVIDSVRNKFETDFTLDTLSSLKNEALTSNKILLNLSDSFITNEIKQKTTNEFTGKMDTLVINENKIKTEQTNKELDETIKKNKNEITDFLTSASGMLVICFVVIACVICALILVGGFIIMQAGPTNLIKAARGSDSGNQQSNPRIYR